MLSFYLFIYLWQGNGQFSCCYVNTAGKRGVVLAGGGEGPYRDTVFFDLDLERWVTLGLLNEGREDASTRLLVMQVRRLLS